jgi:hypothetical protein
LLLQHSKVVLLITSQIHPTFPSPRYITVFPTSHLGWAKLDSGFILCTQKGQQTPPSLVLDAQNFPVLVDVASPSCSIREPVILDNTSNAVTMKVIDKKVYEVAKKVTFSEPKEYSNVSEPR